MTLRAFVASAGTMSATASLEVAFLPPVSDVELDDNLTFLHRLGDRLGTETDPAVTAVVEHPYGRAVRAEQRSSTGDRRDGRVGWWVPLPRASDGRPVLLSVLSGVTVEGGGGATVDALIADIDAAATGTSLQP